MPARGCGPKTSVRSPVAISATPLEALETRQLVQRRPSGAYAFPSAVIRHVAYDTTDADDRVWMHKRLATHLRGLGGGVPPARIARHLEHAGEGEAAATAYLEAAEAARSVYSNRDALRFYARALALLPPNASERFYAHEAREQILRGMGSRRREQGMELEAMRAHAEMTDDPVMRALAYNRLARFELDMSRTAGVDALLRQALDAAIESGSRGAEVEALRLVIQLARETGDTQRALEACDRALARAGLDRELLGARGSVLVQSSQLLRRLGQLQQALEQSAEGVVIFRRLGMKRNEAEALNSLGVVLALMGALEDATAMIRASIAFDREIDDRYHLGIKLSNLGQLYGEIGDADRSLDFLGRALDVFDAVDDPTGRCDALSAVAEQLIEARQDVDAAALRLDEARRGAERTGVHEDLARERIVRVALEAAQGRLDRARSCAREAVDAAAQGGLVALELEGLACLADVTSRMGDLHEARDLARRVRERVRTETGLRMERIHLAAARALARAGEQAEAQEARNDAATIVDGRLAQIRNPTLRKRYLAMPLVRAIRDLELAEDAGPRRRSQPFLVGIRCALEGDGVPELALRTPVDWTGRASLVIIREPWRAGRQGGGSSGCREVHAPEDAPGCGGPRATTHGHPNDPCPQYVRCTGETVEKDLQGPGSTRGST